MNVIVFIAVFALVVGGALWKLYLKEGIDGAKKQPENRMYIALALAAGLAAHIICAVSYKGHPTDMGCFSGWSDDVFKNGLAAFYADEGFHDYPPGYVYVMYILGAVKNLFKMKDGAGLWLWLKAPAIIADLIMGRFVYKTALKGMGCRFAAVLALMVVLNPAVLVDSASWGQIDSILALFCVLSMYFLTERKFLPAYFTFAAGVLIKPQAAFFAPVIVFALVDELFIREKFTSERLLKQLGGAAAAVAAMFVLFMPFGRNPIQGIALILDQYVKTLGEYNYMTINAFNIYAAAGNNWEKLNTISSVFGYGMMAAVTAYAAYIFFKSKSPAKYYLTAFVISFGIYIFGVKMHERYAFPGIFMLAMALAVLPTTKIFTMYGLTSIVSFVQFAWVLFVYNDDINKYYRTETVINLSLTTIAVFVMCLAFIHRDCLGDKSEIKAETSSGKRRLS